MIDTQHTEFTEVRLSFKKKISPQSLNCLYPSSHVSEHKEIESLQLHTDTVSELELEPP